MHVAVTNHAAKRALQRARLFMRQHEQADPKAFLIKDFKRAVVDRRCVDVPFYRNMLQTKYGLNSYVAKTDLFEYRVSIKENDVHLITTVIFLRNA